MGVVYALRMYRYTSKNICTIVTISITLSKEHRTTSGDNKNNVSMFHSNRKPILNHNQFILVVWGGKRASHVIHLLLMICAIYVCEYATRSHANNKRARFFLWENLEYANGYYANVYDDCEDHDFGGGDRRKRWVMTVICLYFHTKSSLSSFRFILIWLFLVLLHKGRNVPFHRK